MSLRFRKEVQKLLRAGVTFMENYEIIKHLSDFQTRAAELSAAVKIEDVKKSVSADEEIMKDPNFYSDMANAQKILKRFKAAKDKVASFEKLQNYIEELEMYFDMHKSGEEDLNKEITDLVGETEIFLSDLEIQMLLNREYDHCDAILELHPGAGGTEAMDWAEMLFRMYRRYAERHDFKFEVLDYQDGEEAGLKSVTCAISGDFAFGFLKGEQGVHRLVRISPFDSNARRHTSFCGCSVIPSIDTEVNIEIRPEDIRVDTFRSSGAGGQKVNKTDSAIRITHLKTGIVVTCQVERSQPQNKERAMNLLKSKLYLLETEENEKKMKGIAGEASDNTFGSQIRSYVFHPYTLVKDHRTDFEVGGVGSVMDGDIDGFINAYLKSEYNVR